MLGWIMARLGRPQTPPTDVVEANLSLLLDRHSQRAVATLHAAVRAGKINGNYFIPTEHSRGGCCVIGWLNQADQRPYMDDITGGVFALVEDLVINVVPGATPQTDPRLCQLDAMLTRYRLHHV